MFDTPGIYIREIPSGSRPISGVATSNCGFVGLFRRGPVNRAVRVTSFGEFERVFGGLMAESEASYAVRAFFLNGGSIAFIVRVTAGAAAAAATVVVDGNLTVTASSVGTWGNAVRVGIAHSAVGTTFTMLVREYQGTQVIREEAFLDVSITPGNARFFVDVIGRDSEMVVVAQTAAALPAATVLTAGAAAVLDDLLEAPLTDLDPLTLGTDGTLPALATPAANGAWLAVAQAAIVGSETAVTGINAFNAIVPELISILCLPDVATSTLLSDIGSVMQTIFQDAYAYCQRNNIFLLVDVPPETDRTNIMAWFTALGAAAGPNSAMYYPRLVGGDPLNPLQQRQMQTSGFAAGLYARTDATRGVWKAPAGIQAAITGAAPIDLMTDRQQGTLNPNGINAIRTFPIYNSVIWGARTLDGADARASEWRYVNVRRLTMFIESSLQRGLQWVVFEANDEPLWANVRLNVNSFMSQLHKQGAFQGASARDAFLVKCDSETTTQADINLGILNVYVGFAPVRPAEFVVVRIQQRFANVA